MLVLQEAASIFKNSGLMEFLLWIFNVRTLNPYSDERSIKLLKSKALVDSMSELLAGISMFTLFAAEKEIREWNGVGLLNVTYLEDLNATNFVSTFCLSTCVGWNVNDGVPPPEITRSRTDLLQLISFTTTVRVLCLGLEVTMLNMIQAKFEEMGAMNANKVVPIAGEKKKFGDMTNEELESWLIVKGFEAVIRGFRKWRVGASMLNDEQISERDIAGFGDFSDMITRKLVVAIKEAIEDGVEGAGGGGTEGSGNKTKAVETRSGMARQIEATRQVAVQQVSDVAEAAASVVASVSVPFLVVSFFLGAASIVCALYVMAWAGSMTKEGITIDLAKE